MEVIFRHTVENAERIKYVKHTFAEMISVVLALQLGDGLLFRHIVGSAQLFDGLLEDAKEFVQGYSAECVVSAIVADVLWLVETAEDADLRELRYSREQDELKVLVGELEYVVKTF